MGERQIFIPSFGNRPDALVGRDSEIAAFLGGLSAQPGHPGRASLFIGQRGMGKTALLLELADRAGAMGFVPASVLAGESMLDEIVQLLQLNGAKHVKPGRRKVKQVSAGAMGFSFGLTFTDEVRQNYGFRVKLSLLCDELARHGKGVLILVDEVVASSPGMRELAATYQHLVGEGKNAAIAMAGLPSAISEVLNDKVLTFLNRASKFTLGPLPLADVYACYSSAFGGHGAAPDPEAIALAAEATRGYPYLMQLVGYYLQNELGGGAALTPDAVGRAAAAARLALADNVYKPCLNPLSNKDMEFLRAMAHAGEPAAVSAIRERLGASNATIQQYRARLIAAGIVAPARRGVLEFTVPFLGEYLRDAAR
jgi:hypothetical protein